MTDFDVITIVRDGKTLATLEPELADQGGVIGGGLVLRTPSGTAVAAIRAAEGDTDPGSAGGNVTLSGSGAGVGIFGGDGRSRVSVHGGDALSNEDGGTIALRAGNDPLSPGASGGSPSSAIVLNAAQRRVSLASAAGEVTVEIAASGNLRLGGKQQAGELTIVSATGDVTVKIDAGANLRLGGKQADGDLMIFAANATTIDAARATCHIDGETGDMHLGANKQSGTILMYPGSAAKHEANKTTASIDGGTADCRLGGNGFDGDLFLLRGVTAGTNTSEASVRLEGAGGNIWAGGHGVDGDLMLFESTETDTSDPANASIHLNGSAGDVLLRNADCAEEFDVAGEAIAPGTVVALDGAGRVAASARPYDTRVAGVVSGAGAYRPGIILDRRQTAAAHRSPVALVGKVFCDVDASNGPIEVGSLLTTSSEPGCAMLAADPTRAFGAVLGKALAAHHNGRGTIPILVALQ